MIRIEVLKEWKRIDTNCLLSLKKRKEKKGKKKLYIWKVYFRLYACFIKADDFPIDWAKSWREREREKEIGV